MLRTKLPHVLNAAPLTFFIELPELSPGALRRSLRLGLVRRRSYFNLMIDPCLKDFQVRLQKRAT